MIIVGYQGIGKSTAAGRYECIDLESGNFWFYDEETHQKVRNNNWYVIYCKIANHLSKQGFTVFVSSHEVVRKELEKSEEEVFVVFPSVELKDKWIKKLRDRYELTGLEKDFKALANAEDRYEENISELKNSNFKFHEIKNMNYDLVDIIKYLEWKSRVESYSER